MATLEALAISGIRNYRSQKLQRIDFTHPLTLINGKNGSGKTTIIECLKYITTGVTPPSTKMEKSFVMDPNIAGTAEVKGDIRLRFRTAKNRVVIAKKVIMVSKTTKGLASKTVEQSLKTKDEQGKQIEVSQRCADIEKQIPQMLGISKPILDNIVFCHQDQSLWPFSDNNTLKGIFDELFDTKRFTKAMQNMKEGMKDYQKQKTQIKSQLEYLKASYYKVCENRNQSLSGLVQVVQASQQIYQIRKELQPLRLKIKQISSKQTNKNNLISSKGVIQYKMLDYSERINKIEEKFRAMGVEPDKKLSRDERTKKLEDVSKQISSKQKQVKMLNIVLQQVRDKESINKVRNQLHLEIKRIRQILPEIDIQSNIDTILLRISQRLAEMRANSKSLKQKKAKISTIVIPTLQYTQLEAKDEKVMSDKLQKKKIELQTMQRKIRLAYSCLYDPNIKQDGSGITAESKRAAQRLSRLQAQIELKKSELKKYQEMKPHKKSLDQQIFQIKYTGIELQSQMLEYARRKKQCGLCMKKLSDQDIEDLKLKMNKTIGKSRVRIEELRRNYNPSTDIDPVPIVREIQNFIDNNMRTMRMLEEQKQKYDKYMACQHQIETNKELNKVMQGLQLKSAFVPGKDRLENGHYSIDQFKQLAHEYRITMSEHKNLTTEVLRCKQRVHRHEQAKISYKKQLQLKQQLQLECLKLQKSLANFHIIENISKKLQQLHNIIKRDSQKESNSEQSSSDLLNQIERAEKLLAQKIREKLELEMGLDLMSLVEEREACKGKLSNILKQISIIMAERSENSELENRKNKLEVQQAKLSSKIQLKKSIHSRFLEEQPVYLTKLLRFNVLCSISSDIQSTLKAMERATNRLHNEKMDQINKILLDIWQEVYHANDIEFIRINSVAEKKNNGYGYSIMMQKNGQLIEMKGRCSMGQKVLASIIIRMALAQAFSASTHILTLDEPTTNLDRIHIERLAESISSIIRMEQNSRLQLIIISHDMQFLGLLKKHANYFYEVSRNEKNFSTIKKRQIVELGQDSNNNQLPRLEAVHY